MIKLVFCLHRLPHLSRAEFQEYWRNVHGPLVVQQADALGIRRYVQSHALDDATFEKLAASRGGRQSYDGVAELWFDDVPGRRAGESTNEAVRAAMELLEDEKRFIDLSRSTIFYVREDEVLPLM